MNSAHHGNAILRHVLSKYTDSLVRTSLFRFCHRYSVRGASEIRQRFLSGYETAIFGVSWAISEIVDKICLIPNLQS